MRNLLIATAIMAASFLLLLGVRSIRVRRRHVGWRREFLLALSAALATISGVRAQDPPPATAQDPQQDFDIRVKEVEREPVWRKMRKIYRELARQMEANDAVTRDLSKETDALLKDLPVTPRQKPQADEEPLLSRQEALGECALFLTQMAAHVWRIKGAGRQMTCYKVAAPVRNPHVPEQRDLLKRQLEEGKISQAVYDRVIGTLDEIGLARSLLQNLNARNTALVFRLVRDMAGAYAVDIPVVAPEVEKRIGELIEQLGADEIEKREAAQEALVQIGPGAIPRLRKALEHESAEVRGRAQAILEELE
ncbi:MAG: hypothetical protein HYY16_18150 [Planctomycetes bacterium]|nr:hypothetical protein [Planctomycetota bacterium]